MRLTVRETKILLKAKWMKNIALNLQKLSTLKIWVLLQPLNSPLDGRMCVWGWWRYINTNANMLKKIKYWQPGNNCFEFWLQLYTVVSAKQDLFVCEKSFSSGSETTNLQEKAFEVKWSVNGKTWTFRSNPETHLPLPEDEDDSQMLPVICANWNLHIHTEASDCPGTQSHLHIPI